MLIDLKSKARKIGMIMSAIYIYTIIFSCLPVSSGDTWYNVALISGRGPKTSGPIQISEPDFRLEYSYIAKNPELADFQVFVYQMSVPFFHIDFIQESGASKNGYFDIFSGNDTFFIFVNTYEVESWEVAVLQQGIVVETPTVEYEPLVTFSGSGGTNTPTFTTNGDHFKVEWSYTAQTPYDAVFWVLTYPTSISEFVNMLGDYGPSTNGTEYVYTADYRDFYFNVITDENVLDWKLDISQLSLEPRNITCAVNPKKIQKGSMVIINGAISPAFSHKTITLTFTDPYNDTFTQTTETEADGSYSFHFYPTYIGNYTVRASCINEYPPSEIRSNVATFSVFTKFPVTIWCGTPRTQYVMDEKILVGGNLNPKLVGVNVTINYRDPLGKTHSVTVKTDENGEFEYDIIPSSIGHYSIWAHWPGNEMYSEAVSYTDDVNVLKVGTRINCYVPQPNTYVTQPIEIHGTTHPNLSGKNLTLIFTLPDNTTITSSVQINQDGNYSYTFYPPLTGETRVHAIWAGDDIYEPAESLWPVFNVSRIPTSISCGVSLNKVPRTGLLDITGSVSEEISTEITLHLVGPDGSFDQEITVPTQSDGSYNYSLQIGQDTEVGNWVVFATWDGTDILDEATSSFIGYTVIEEPSSVILQIGAREDNEPDVSIYSLVSPKRQGKMTIKITSPDGQETEYTPEQDDGSYRQDIKVDNVGVYTVDATFVGDDGSISHSEPKSFHYNQNWIPGFPIQSIIIGLSFIIFLLRAQSAYDSPFAQLHPFTVFNCKKYIISTE